MQRLKNEKKSKEEIERLAEEAQNAYELRLDGYDEYDARVLSQTHNDPVPESCPKCKTGKYLKYGSGMVGEPTIYCSKCLSMLWNDTVAAIRSVL